METRKAKKAAPTVHALNLVIKELLRLKDLGQDPKTILEKSIKSGWADVYPLKDFQKNTSGAAAPKPGKYDGVGEKI